MGRQASQAEGYDLQQVRLVNLYALVARRWRRGRSRWSRQHRLATELRCLRVAWVTSPMRSMSPQASARMAATRVHPQSTAIQMQAMRTCHGIAMWWETGSALLQAKNVSQASWSTRRSLGIFEDTLFIVSA